MDSLRIKEDIHQIIDEIEDEKILLAIHQMLYARKSNDVSLREFEQLIEKAEQDIKGGRVTDQQNLKNEIASWRKK